MIRGSPLAQRRARAFRRSPSKAERLLWWALRANRQGWHFRRQHAAGPYVLDFYCHAARLCIEIDGAQHDFRAGHDARRDATLAAEGIATMRVDASEVERSLAGVVEWVLGEVERRAAARTDPSDPASPGHLP